MTERTNFYFYIFFSLLNTFVFCVPACWLWSEGGFLRSLGVVDVAGSCGVNLVGGTGALVAAVMLGPRMGRWDQVREPPMGSAGNAIIGLFMLWWAWIAFNQVNSPGEGQGWRTENVVIVGFNLWDQWQEMDPGNQGYNHLHPGLLQWRPGWSGLQFHHQEREDGRDVGLQRDPGRSGQRDGRLCKFPPESEVRGAV